MYKNKSYFAAAVIVVLVVITFIHYLNYRQKATIKLTVPNSYSIGELIVLDASTSDADDLIWKILPKTSNFKIIGKTAMFSSIEPIDYTIIIVARNNEDMVCKMFTLRHSNSKSVPIAITSTNFEKEVVNWLKDANLIKNRIEGQKLAQSFKIVGRTIEGGVYDSIDEIVSATAYANSDALGDNLEAWKPFLASFQKYLEENPPNTIKDHAKIWDNMAEALKKVYK